MKYFNYFSIKKIQFDDMLMTFSMLEMPPKCFFGHVIKKHGTSAFLKVNSGVRTKIAKNMIV